MLLSLQSGANPKKDRNDRIAVTASPRPSRDLLILSQFAGVAWLSLETTADDLLLGQL